MRPTEIEPDAILQLLTSRQHLHPHQPLADVLRALTDQLGCCPAAQKHAIDWLVLDVQQPIGRLRRTEIMQLANAIERFWRRAISAAPDRDSIDSPSAP
jgi:hypothetical protein